MEIEGMVHALEEAERVVVPGGQILDLRPVSTETRLEILSGEIVQTAGIVDFRGGLEEDHAADRAVAQLERRGRILSEATRRFDHAYYWDELASMRSYAEEHWSDSTSIPARVFRKAEDLIHKSVLPPRIRVKLLVHLSAYRLPGRPGR